jgi:hypothetical protein
MLLMSLGLAGCVSQPETAGENAYYGVKDGVVWVQGPWDAITPSENIDELIDQLCPAIVGLPAAAFREYGQEYCGLIYSLGDGTYYASHPSPLGRTELSFVNKRKQCFVPKLVFDSRGLPLPTADFHSHPWAGSEMSQQDRRNLTQVYSIRIQFDTECKVMKLIPYKNESRPGEVYSRVGKSWKLIALIKPEDKEEGIMTPIKE